MSEPVAEQDQEQDPGPETDGFPKEEGDAGVDDTGAEPWYQDTDNGEGGL
jgi:hypothetical protein